MSDTMPVSRPGSTDPRARRSRARLQKGLLDCLRDDRAPSVAAVVAAAGVARSTFYVHYRDLDELVEDTFSGLDVVLPAGPGRFEAFVGRLFEHVGRHPELASALLRPERPEFANRLRRMVLVRLAGEPPLRAAVVADGLIGALRWWLDRVPTRPAAEVAVDFLALWRRA